MTKQILFTLIFALLYSCASTQNISYFQDIDIALAKLEAKEKIITLKEGDKVAVVVKDANDKTYTPLNPPNGEDKALSNNLDFNGAHIGYTIDSNGNLTLPEIGTIKAKGMSREELSNLITSKLRSVYTAKKFVVVVEYLNLNISVLGEVAKPGRYAIDKEKYTIFDALGAAGDLTIYGKRDNIKLLRTTDKGIKSIVVNLNSLAQLYKSEAYYLEQNDVIYVEPNKVKQRQSTLNGNNVRQTSFWVSIVSLLTTASLLIFL